MWCMILIIARNVVHNRNKTPLLLSGILRLSSIIIYTTGRNVDISFLFPLLKGLFDQQGLIINETLDCVILLNRFVWQLICCKCNAILFN